MRTWLTMFFSLCIISMLVGCREQTLGPYTTAGPDLAQPGQPVGVAGPGPGVDMGTPNMGYGQPGAVPPEAAAMKTSQLAFVGPSGAKIRWDVSAQGMFDSEEMVCPFRQDFPQSGIYRLKLTDIPGHAGLELYPTVEVAPAMPRTQAFLAHSMIPVNFTEEDLMQVRSGNFVTKVIYLPDPEFQELALAVGTPDTIVSTRLDPGVDPVAEADRRGAILAIVRMGNKSVEPEMAAMNSIVTDENGNPIPGAAPAAMGPAGASNQSNYISGVTGPEYGQPITATPHGIPGPTELPPAEPAHRRGTYPTVR